MILNVPVLTAVVCMMPNGGARGGTCGELREKSGLQTLDTAATDGARL